MLQCLQSPPLYCYNLHTKLFLVDSFCIRLRKGELYVINESYIIGSRPDFYREV